MQGAIPNSRQVPSSLRGALPALGGWGGVPGCGSPSDGFAALTSAAAAHIHGRQAGSPVAAAAGLAAATRQQQQQQQGAAETGASSGTLGGRFMPWGCVAGLQGARCFEVDGGAGRLFVPESLPGGRDQLRKVCAACFLISNRA